MNTKKTDMIFLTLISLTLIIGGVLLFRNSLIADIRKDAVESFYIPDRNTTIEFDDYGTYDEMLMNFSGWDFEYFYPNLKRVTVPGRDSEALRKRAIAN